MRVEQIGDATLYLGDCLEILPTLPNVDAVITDPPYAVSVAGSAQRGMPGKGVRRLDFFTGDDDWTGMKARVAAAVDLCIKKRPLSFAAWCGHRQIGLIVDSLEAAGYSTRLIFWRKKFPPPAGFGAGFSSAVECSVYGYLPGRPWNGGQYEANIFDCDSYRHGQPGKEDHPTQKPIALMGWQIKTITAPDSVVLDCFMGSGTTGVACAQLGRKFIGIEIEPKYFDIACRRMERAYAQGKLFQEPAKKPEQVPMWG